METYIRHKLGNIETFIEALEAQYGVLFLHDPDYGYIKARNTPAGLAIKITEGLITGTADKDGKGIRSACKLLGIKHTYKAIREYLNGGAR